LGGLPYVLSQLNESKKDYSYDIIYASQHVISTTKPWVVDLEFANALAGYCSLISCKNIIAKKLKSKECKAILPWSNWSKETLLNSLDCEEFSDKIQVLRYTVSPKSFHRIKKDRSIIRLLFLGSMNPANANNFEFKGLYEIMDAFIDLQRKYDNLELVIRSTITPEIKEKAKKYPNIKILSDPLTDSEIQELFMSSDIFPHTGFEVLNLSVLEAMSYGLAVVATSLYNTPEAIQHMKNGLLISPPQPSVYYNKNKTPNDYSRTFLKSMRRVRPFMTGKIKESLKLLIEDSSLRNKISYEAVRTINEGEFSIKNKNFLLKEIFDSSV
jgi:glycosyltransferase involved in cell wall biosynthesis